MRTINSNSAVVGGTSEFISFGGSNDTLTFIGTHHDTVQAHGLMQTINVTGKFPQDLSIVSSGHGLNVGDTGANTLTIFDFNLRDTVTLNHQGFWTAADAVAHMTSDQHGGTLLMTAGGGSIDFVNNSHVLASQIIIGTPG